MEGFVATSNMSRQAGSRERVETGWLRASWWVFVMWKKVVAPTVLVSLLWLVGSGITTYYLQQVYASHASALSENVTTIRAAWAMLDALWQLQVVVVEAPGKEPRETQIEAAERQADFEQHLREAEDTAYTPEEHDQIKAVREHFSLYRDHIQERLRPTGLTDLLVPQAAERAKTIRLARGVADPCRQLLALNERMLANAQERSTRLGSLVNVFRNVFLIAGPILGLLCGLWIARHAPLDFANQRYAQGSYGRIGPGT